MLCKQQNSIVKILLCMLYFEGDSLINAHGIVVRGIFFF